MRIRHFRLMETLVVPQASRHTIARGPRRPAARLHRTPRRERRRARVPRRRGTAPDGQRGAQALVPGPGPRRPGPRFQFLHGQLTDAHAGDLTVVGAEQRLLNAAYRTLQRFVADWPLGAGTHHGVEQLLPVERLTGAVLFDDHKRNSLHDLISFTELPWDAMREHLHG